MVTRKESLRLFEINLSPFLVIGNESRRFLRDDVFRRLSLVVATKENLQSKLKDFATTKFKSKEIAFRLIISCEASLMVFAKGNLSVISLKKGREWELAALWDRD